MFNAAQLFRLQLHWCCHRHKSFPFTDLKRKNLKAIIVIVVMNRWAVTVNLVFAEHHCCSSGSKWTAHTRLVGWRCDEMWNLLLCTLCFSICFSALFLHPSCSYVSWSSKEVTSLFFSLWATAEMLANMDLLQPVRILLRSVTRNYWKYTVLLRILPYKSTVPRWLGETSNTVLLFF